MTVAPDSRSAVDRCRAESPTQCTAHTRLYRDGRLVAEGFPVAQVSDHLAQPGTVIWLDLLLPSPTDMQVLTEELGLHPLAIEDALHDHQRPKLDRYPDHDFLAAYAVRARPGADSLLETGELAAFFTPRALITVRKSPLLELADLLQRWDDSAQLAASGVAYLAHGLLDHLVDGHTAAVAVLDDEAEELEDLLFDEGGQRGGDLQRR
ncbi:MAG: CorA family divalent cation transporter, partial [Candidatus Limnocylindrales bacterium]